MSIERKYWVYILTNVYNSVFYVGVTNNLMRRVYEHRTGIGSVFTKKYKVCKLVYFETANNILFALRREKQLKAGSRKKKISLVRNVNPKWRDLYGG